MTGLRYANRAFNSMALEQIRAYQERRLVRQIEYVYANSEYYRRRFAAVGAEPGDIRTLEDYYRLPVLMDKEQERLSQAESMAKHGHPFGSHLCCPPEDVAITATTSGTSGLPTFTYTLAQDDKYNLAPAMGLMLAQAGLGRGDRMLFSYALGIYATSVALPSIRRAGILPIDVDVRTGADGILMYSGLTKPVASMTTPSLAQYLVKRAEGLGQNVRDLNFRGLFLVGEIGVGVPSTKKYLEESWGCRAYDWIAPAGQTLAFSCDSVDYHGMHAVTPDLDLYPLDLVDPETKEHIEVSDGVEGEAVYTSLWRKALPLVRYASGDVVRVTTEPCPACGFTGARLFVTGRADDMLIVKGVNVYPGAVKRIVNEFAPDVTGEMRIVLNSPPPLVEPPLRIKVEHADHVREAELAGLQQRITQELHNRIRVSPEFEWVPAGSIERAMAKTPLFEKRY